MKLNLFILFLILSVQSQAQNCINHENLNINYALNWKTNGNVQSIIPRTDPDPLINWYIEFVDGPNASIVYNDVDFKGNWLTRYNTGCFCFDYKIQWTVSSGNPSTGPQIMIYTGANPLNGNSWPTGLIYATFRTPFDASLNGIWKNFCLPLENCKNGKLPSNQFGSWYINHIDSCKLWDQIITNVTGIIIPTDYNPQSNERVSFDNFACKECNTPIVFDPCCPPVNGQIIQGLFTDKRLTTGLNSDYRLEFNNILSFRSPLQAYCDYIKSIYSSLTKLQMEWRLIDAGTGTTYNTSGPIISQVWNHFSPGVGGNIQGGTNFFTPVLQVNHWYKIHLGVYTVPELNFIKPECSAGNFVYFNIKVAGSYRMMEITDGKTTISKPLK